MFFSPLAGTEIAIVDDLEDNDIAEYKYNTGNFTTQSTTVKEGSYALEYTATSNSHMTSYSGLNYYPQQGDTIKWNGYLNGSNYILLYFACQSGTGDSSTRPDGYASFLDLSNSEFKLRKRDAGTNSTLASSSFTFSTGEWYEVKLDWASDGTMTHTLYDSTGSTVASHSATDTTFTSGGITWQANDSAYMDYARVV